MNFKDAHGSGYGMDDLIEGAGLADGIKPILANEVCSMSDISNKDKDEFCRDRCSKNKMAYHHTFEDGCMDITRRFTCFCAHKPYSIPGS